MSASLRSQVEKLLPNWASWYPSVFDAARDLGLIRARVCDPNTLLLSSRHQAVQSQAEIAHKEQWGGILDNTENLDGKPAGGNGRRRKRRRRR